jgi:hypothetical protein
MIHSGKDCEGLEWVELDDYDNHLVDPLDKDVDITMDSEFPDNIKVEGADDIQKNAVGSSMRSAPNAGIVRSRQTRSIINDSSMGDLCTIINTGRDARNVITARQ